MNLIQAYPMGKRTAGLLLTLIGVLAVGVGIFGATTHSGAVQLGCW
ncbi:MAG: hypothetical protein RSD57_16690 [Comamonas sp.]